MEYHSLLAKYPIVSDQITKDELAVLLRELAAVLHQNTPGDVVELGCYEGTSALFEARMLKQQAPSKQLWLYDSFEGLPPKTTSDHSPAGTQFVAGELRASKQTLLQHFRKAGLPLPRIRKAWFSDLQPQHLPPQICFAFLDGDFYESIYDSLKLVVPLVQPGGTIVVDDYHNEQLPGAAKAVHDYFATHNPAILQTIKTEKSLGIIRF